MEVEIQVTLYYRVSYQQAWATQNTVSNNNEEEDG